VTPAGPAPETDAHDPPAMPTTPDPLRSLTTGTFRFQMALRPGDGSRFFAPGAGHAAVMAERRALLAQAAGSYAAALPGTAALLNATAALVHQWLTQTHHPDPPPPPAPLSGDAGTLAAWCAETGGRWEPDWVVLRRGEDAAYRLVAGAVCFPSGWSLPEKLGQPLDTIHAPVPGLNRSLGPPIHQFLERLKPDTVWWRDNWGLSADPALNHHPSVPRHRLTAAAHLSTTWLRREDQLLARLPGTPDILFGIRVSSVRLDEVTLTPEVTRRLADSLRSMPEDVATYKGIAPARDALVRELEAALP